jgi:hypothetical protein
MGYPNRPGMLPTMQGRRLPRVASPANSLPLQIPIVGVNRLLETDTLVGVGGRLGVVPRELVNTWSRSRRNWAVLDGPVTT